MQIHDSFGYIQNNRGATTIRHEFCGERDIADTSFVLCMCVRASVRPSIRPDLSGP